MKTNKKLVAIIAILIFGAFFIPEVEAQHIINNDSIRFGDGTEQSINSTGSVQQPFYYSLSQADWRKLTFSTYPLDNSVALGGDGTDEWNLNGTRIDNPTLTGQVIDASGFTLTSGNNGYGTIKSTGTVNVAGQDLELEHTYMLGETDNFVNITCKITNMSASNATNLRYWVGTRDDYVGGTDGPKKERGNLVGGAFTLIGSTAERASALKITTDEEGILFYTDTYKGNCYIRDGYTSWDNVTLQNPATSSITLEGDDSYVFYVRMNDLAPGESDEFTWYYGAGELDVIDDIIADIAAAAGDIQNITCDGATFTARVDVDATGYFIVVPKDSQVPTEAQIKAGVDYAAVTVLASGSAAMTADVEHDFVFSGLTVETDYDLHFVAEDIVPQFTDIVSVSFNTDDQTAPTPDSPALSDITGTCEVTSLPTPTGSDNCSATVTVTNDATLPITTQGTTVVTWTYDDGHGNTSTQTQNVVIDDVTAPTPDSPTLSPINVECEVTSLTTPTGTDECATTVTVTHDQTLPITSSTTITWTYDDGHGNTYTQTQSVAVEDVTPPTPDLMTLPDIVVECEVTSLTPPTATDNCAYTVTATHNQTLPITTPGDIIWTYDDGNGNTYTQTQTIVFEDVTPPTPDVELLTPITAECEVTSLTDPTATDNCSPAVTVTHDQTLPITSSTTITWTYDDGNGNTATQEQLVEIEDLSAPVPDVENLDDIVAGCEIYEIPYPYATDNCAGSIEGTPDISLPLFEQGTYTITWTYNDGNGNTYTQTQNLILSDDVPPTVITQDIDVYLNSENLATITPEMVDADSYDDCELSELALDIWEFTIADLGTNSVILYAIDNAGNISSGTATVTVMLETGVSELGNNLKIYPNPSNGLITVEATDFNQITITDVTGKIILEQEMNNEITNIDLSSQQKGVYFINLIGENHKTVSKIVIY